MNVARSTTPTPLAPLGYASGLVERHLSLARRYAAIAHGDVVTCSFSGSYAQTGAAPQVYPVGHLRYRPAGARSPRCGHPRGAATPHYARGIVLDAPGAPAQPCSIGSLETAAEKHRPDARDMRQTHHPRTGVGSIPSHSGVRQVVIASKESDQADGQHPSPGERSRLWAQGRQADDTTRSLATKDDGSRTIHQRLAKPIAGLAPLAPASRGGLDTIDTYGIMPGLATETFP